MSNNIGKKKILELNAISVVDEICRGLTFRTIGQTHWLDTPPEMWIEEETKLFDLVTEIEMKFRAKVLQALGIEQL